MGVILKLLSNKFLKLKSFFFFRLFSTILLFFSILKMNSSFRLLMVAIVATALLQTFVAGRRRGRGHRPGLRQDAVYELGSGSKCYGTVQTCCHQGRAKLADLLQERVVVNRHTRAIKCPKVLKMETRNVSNDDHHAWQRMSQEMNSLAMKQLRKGPHNSRLLAIG